MISKLSLPFLFLFLPVFAYSQVTIGGAAFHDPDYNNNNNLLNLREVSMSSKKEGQQNITSIGIANYVADTYVATFNIEVQETTKQMVEDEANKRLNGLKQSLVGLGFATENIKIELVDLVPAFEVQAENKFLSKSYAEKPVGFTCQKTITIVFSKSEDLDVIMSKALEFDIYDLVKVDFHLKDLKTKKEALKEKCLAELTKKASMMKKMGVKIDSSTCIIHEDFNVIYPSSRYSTYQAYSSTSNYDLNKKVVKVAKAGKVLTRYYNQLEYSNYDVVENPIVTEPVVQITYSILLQYMDVRAEKKEKYKVLTTNGTVVDLKF